MGLKEAIEKARRKKQGAIPSPFGDVRSILEELLAPIVKDLEQQVQKEFSTRVGDFISKYEYKFKGEPGKAGADAVVDFDAVALEASKRIQVPTAEEIASLVVIPKIREAALVQKVLDRIVFDEEGLFNRLKERLLELPLTEGTTKDIKGTKTAQKLGVKDIIGLDTLIANIQRSMRQANRGMIHGGGMTLKAAGGQTLVRNEDGTWTLTGGSSSAFYSEVLTDTGDHQNFTSLHAINTVLTLMDGSGKGIPLKDGGGNTNYTVSGTNLKLASPDANLASIGINIVYA